MFRAHYIITPFVHFSVLFFLYPHRFCRRATSFRSHYIYHIFNGYNNFCFFQIVYIVYIFFFAFSIRYVGFGTLYRPLCVGGKCGIFVYAVFLSCKHITISLCQHNNALSSPVALLQWSNQQHSFSGFAVFCTPFQMNTEHCFRLKFAAFLDSRRPFWSTFALQLSLFTLK